MIFFFILFRIFNWTKRIFLREANLSVFGLAMYIQIKFKVDRLQINLVAMLHPLFGKA